MFVCVCVCLFPNLIFTSKERPFKWTNFLALHHDNLFAPHVSFVRATSFIQNFHFLALAKNFLISANHEPSHHCKLFPSSVTSPLLRS